MFINHIATALHPRVGPCNCHLAQRYCDCCDCFFLRLDRRFQILLCCLLSDVLFLLLFVCSALRSRNFFALGFFFLDGALAPMLLVLLTNIGFGDLCLRSHFDFVSTYFFLAEMPLLAVAHFYSFVWVAPLSCTVYTIWFSVGSSFVVSSCAIGQGVEGWPSVLCQTFFW